MRMSKQRGYSLLMSVICFIVISFGMLMPVNAAKYSCDACGVDHDTDIVTVFVVEMANMSSNINFFKEDPGSGIGLTALLEFDTSNNTIFKSLWHGASGMISVKVIFEALIPIASVLATVYFLLELSEKVLSEQFSAEQLIVAFIRLGLALLVILNGFQIMTLISEFCTFVFTTLQKATNVVPANGGICFFNSIKDMNVFEKAGYLLSLLFSYIFMLGAWLLILVTAWKRVFEIVVYAMFFPIGISDVVRGGLQSTGVRYMKTMAAKFLQGAVCLAIIVGYNLVSSMALTSGTAAGSVGTILLALTVMTLMMQSGNIASSIIGA